MRGPPSPRNKVRYSAQCLRSRELRTLSHDVIGLLPDYVIIPLPQGAICGQMRICKDLRIPEPGISGKGETESGRCESGPVRK